VFIIALCALALLTLQANSCDGAHDDKSDVDVNVQPVPEPQPAPEPTDPPAQ
jgi:hypothetical protein